MPGLVAGDAGDSLDPDRVLDHGRRRPGSIFRYRITFRQPLTSAFTSSVSTVPAWPASTVIDGLPRVVAVFSRYRERRILRPVGRDDDVSRPKASTISRDISSCFSLPVTRPVAVGPQVLVEVAAVQVDQVVALLDDLPS